MNHRVKIWKNWVRMLKRLAKNEVSCCLLMATTTLKLHKILMRQHKSDHETAEEVRVIINKFLVDGFGQANAVNDFLIRVIAYVEALSPSVVPEFVVMPPAPGVH